MKIEDVLDLKDAIGLAKAAEMMRGRGGRPPCVESVRRWANPEIGCPLPGGEVAVLMTVKLNGEWLTLPEWVEAFERRRVARGRRGGRAAPQGRTERQRAAGQRRAEAALDEAGIK